MDVDSILGMDDLSPELLDGVTVAGSKAIATPIPSGDDDSSHLVGKSLREIERWAIETTLKLTGGNREETANMLGISERNLYRKLNEYELR